MPAWEEDDLPRRTQTQQTLALGRVVCGRLRRICSWCRRGWHRSCGGSTAQAINLVQVEGVGTDGGLTLDDADEPLASIRIGRAICVVLVVFFVFALAFLVLLDVTGLRRDFSRGSGR